MHFQYIEILLGPPNFANAEEPVWPNMQGGWFRFAQCKTKNHPTPSPPIMISEWFLTPSRSVLRADPIQAPIKYHP